MYGQSSGNYQITLERAGGQLLISGSLTFEHTFHTCPGCAGFFWKEKPNSSQTELLPEEAARKQFARRVGRIALTGPGRIVVISGAHSTGTPPYPEAEVKMYTSPYSVLTTGPIPGL